MLLKPDYTALQGLTLALSVGMCLLSIPGVFFPERYAPLLQKFPRSKIAGLILAFITMLWTSLWAPIILQEFLPGVAPKLTPFYQAVFPLSVALLFFVLKDLLACRAVGFLFVLLPTPLLSAARWHPSPARYCVIVFAYILVVSGMYFIARPWLLRNAITWSTKSTTRLRAVSIAIYAVANLLLILACSALALTPGQLPLGQC